MTHRARLSGQLLTLRWPVPSLNFLADSAFRLSVHVSHSSVPPLVGLPEKPGQGQDSCELWAVESHVSQMYPGWADLSVGSFSSLPSHCLLTLQRSCRLPTHCGRRQGPGGWWGRGLHACRCVSVHVCMWGCVSGRAQSDLLVRGGWW